MVARKDVYEFTDPLGETERRNRQWKRVFKDLPTIIVDSREILRYHFPCPSRVATLKTGDYSAEGLEDLLCIERKALPDLLGCIGKSRDRFERELERMRSFRYPFLLIESTLQEMARGEWSYSMVHPSQVIGSVFAWSMEYGVHPVFAGDRAHGAATVMRLVALATRQATRNVDSQQSDGYTTGSDLRSNPSASPAPPRAPP